MNGNRPKLIGVAGPAGAGKDEVISLLHRLYGGEDFSTGDVARVVTRFIYHLPADAMPVRDQLYKTATFLRGIDPVFMVKLGIFQSEMLNIKLSLITGLRTIGEADAIHAHGGIIIGVNADTKLRYDRIYSRQRDTEANKTYEQFLMQDEHENKGISDTGPMRGISTIIAEADIVIENNGTLEDLEKQVKAKLGSVLA